MLYINAIINEHPVQLFIDTGAETSVISRRCADKCHIMRHVDVDYEGTAVGVGTTKIIGSIHALPVKI